LRKNTPESAEAFAEKAYALMPHVKITELLTEVDQWTSLGDRFLHLRTQAPPKNPCVSRVLVGIVADPQLRADDHARDLRAQLFSSVTD
jgi:hypothetical protein